MKPIIKELLLQAGGSHYPSVNPEQQQLFARLIAQRCAEIARAGLAEPVAQVIEEEFGIK